MGRERFSGEGLGPPVPSSTFSTSMTSVLIRPLKMYKVPLIDLVLLVDFLLPVTLKDNGKSEFPTKGSITERVCPGQGGAHGVSAAGQAAWVGHFSAGCFSSGNKACTK